MRLVLGRLEKAGTSHPLRSLKTRYDAFWVNHVSGYEHNLWPRYGDAVAKERVGAMTKLLRRELCRPRADAFHAGPRGRATLVVVPFYGGAARAGNRNATAEERAKLLNTGTARAGAEYLGAALRNPRGGLS